MASEIYLRIRRGPIQGHDVSPLFQLYRSRLLTLASRIAGARVLVRSRYRFTCSRTAATRRAYSAQASWSPAARECTATFSRYRRPTTRSSPTPGVRLQAIRCSASGLYLRMYCMPLWTSRLRSSTLWYVRLLSSCRRRRLHRHFYAMQQVNTPWNIRSDGVFLTEPPQQLLMKGQIANIPIVIGTCTLIYPLRLRTHREYIPRERRRRRQRVRVPLAQCHVRPHPFAPPCTHPDQSPQHRRSVLRLPLLKLLPQGKQRRARAAARLVPCRPRGGVPVWHGERVRVLAAVQAHLRVPRRLGRAGAAAAVREPIG